MRNIYILFFFLICTGTQAQSLVQAVNSGSVIAPSSMVSIGEIVVVPATDSQPASGMIGILAQVNEQLLEVPHIEVSAFITAYPNPTAAKIFFKTDAGLANNEVAVFNSVGQTVLSGRLNAEKSFDLSSLPSGIYLVQLAGANNQAFKIIKH
jgi:hypothetical protein